MNLASKYRPQSFSDVTEQGAIVDILKKICSDAELPNRNFLFIGPAGTGKAQPLYSKVLTPNGYVTMKDISVGTQVIDGDGNIVEVTGVYPQGDRPCYEIVFDDNTYIHVADNHLNVVIEHLDHKSVKYKVMETTELLEAERFKKDATRSYFVPIGTWGTLKPYTGSVNPYLIGAFASAGFIEFENIVFRNVNAQALAKLASILSKDWNCYLECCIVSGNHCYKVVSDGDGAEAALLLSSIRNIFQDMSFSKRILPIDCICWSQEDRQSLLEGLKCNNCEFLTPNYYLSRQYAEILSSLGYSELADAELGFDNTDLLRMYRHRSGAFQRNYRKIVDITYLGNIDCQCIMVDSPTHTYITDFSTVTHNTTLGRIISRQLNDGPNGVIEIDAASHSGADAARDITAQARAYPVGSKWKCFIVDECVTGDTEILTNSGWKRIDSISKSDKIAQYTQFGTIQFVDKWEYVKKEYSGDMYDVAFRNGKRHVLMSPHHVQPVRMHTSGRIREQYVSDCKFTQSTDVIVAGKGTGNNELLSPLDRLYIACQADGYCNKNYKEAYWELHLKLPEKIARTKELLEACDIPYSVYGHDDVSIKFYHEFPRNKKLSSYFDLDMGVDRAKDFISEILKWDGSVKSGYPGYYSCTDKDNVDFVSAVLTLCGYSGIVNVDISKNSNHKDVWSVNWFYQDYRTGQAVSKTKVENFSGTIYCVKVPSQMIVLRSQGFAFVSGNCHSISSQGWQVLLKTLEESPARSIFILCTTNPEKIPQTILSRVQTFRLSKISIDGITNRLKHICDCEILEGANLTYDVEALKYIAKLGNGGMRDSIQLLDRAIAYSKDITSENLAVALDLPDYNIYFDLLNGVAKKDNSEIVRIITEVYDSGTNFVKWFEGFHSFVCQIVKYIYLQDITKTMIPSHYQAKISNYGAAHAVLCLRLANTLLNLNHSLKTTNYLQEVAITYLCTSQKR